MIHINYCNHCINELKSYGEFALFLYEQICEHYIFNDAAFPMEESYYLEEKAIKTTIDFLELKRFIITTDVSVDGFNAIYIKPLGHESNDTHTFCNHNHK